jgi:membrane protein YqaA with SNARE-associated domain
MASVLGGMLGYLIGYGLWDAASSFFFEYVPGFSEDKFQYVLSHYQEQGFLYVFLAGLTPIPYKIFTIASGVFQMNFPLFVLASAISRSLRFFGVAALFWKFGPSIKVFIDKYFNILGWIFFILLFGGFLVIKYLI